jgi:hypothetical protein
LIHIDLENSFTIEAIISNFAVGNVLSQIGDDKVQLHLVAFYSKKFRVATFNHQINDKELIAVVDSSKQCVTFLKVLLKCIIVYDG